MKKAQMKQLEERVEEGREGTRPGRRHKVRAFFRGIATGFDMTSVFGKGAREYPTVEKYAPVKFGDECSDWYAIGADFERALQVSAARMSPAEREHLHALRQQKNELIIRYVREIARRNVGGSLYGVLKPGRAPSFVWPALLNEE